MENSREKPGFKITDSDNWLQPDPLMEILVNRNPNDGSISQVQGTDFINYVRRTQLSDSVPTDVWLAFNFAVGGIGYGYFYYPLFTIVAQQALRVADFAIDKLFEVLGREKVHSFARRLTILYREGLISEPELNRWDGIRRLRNSATHPAWQENWGHSMSLQMIETVATAISALPWPKS